MLTWQKYCDECKKWGMSNPYADEAAFNRAYGIVETKEPLVIVPKRDARKVSARFESHVESPIHDAKTCGFESVGEWYDYHEAMRTLSRIRKLRN